MTKDEKIVFYNKIEKALKIEYPVIAEGLTSTMIREVIQNLVNLKIIELKGDGLQDKYNTLKKISDKLSLCCIDEEINVDDLEPILEQYTILLRLKKESTADTGPDFLYLTSVDDPLISFQANSDFEKDHMIIKNVKKGIYRVDSTELPVSPMSTYGVVGNVEIINSDIDGYAAHYYKVTGDGEIINITYNG